MNRETGDGRDDRPGADPRCATNSPKTIAEVDDAIQKLPSEFAKTCDDSTQCYPFLFIDEEITAETVDRVFDDLQCSFGANLSSGRLAVIVASPGGDINAAYNLA